MSSNPTAWSWRWPFAKRPPSPAANDRAADLFDQRFQRRLEYLSIVSRRRFRGRLRAERRSRKAGSGIEFADHREYAPGDDFRYLDWNLYARSGRLLLRLFEEEEDLLVHLLIDSSRSMVFGAPPKLEYAKRLVAALAYLALANLDRVSVVSFAPDLEQRLAPTRGKNRIFKILAFLNALEAEGTTSTQAAMRTFVAQQKRKGVAIVVSDFYDPSGFEEGINTLRYHRFEPYVIQVFDPLEARPTLAGDLQLVDQETGVARDVTVTPQMLARYVRVHESYRRRIAEFCASKQVPYFGVETSVPFDDAVLDILRRGGLVG